MADEEVPKMHNFFPSAEEERRNRGSPDLPPEIAQKNEEASSSRQRKMKEVATENIPELMATLPSQTPLPHSRAHYFPSHQQPQPSFTTPRPNLSAFFRSDNIGQPSLINPMAASLSSLRPASFTSMLMAGDEHEYLPPLVRQQNGQIDQLMAAQSAQLRRSVAEVQRRQYFLLSCEAEEKAAKKIRAKDMELNELKCKHSDLERRETMFRSENQMLQNKVKSLEQTTAYLKAQIQEAIAKGEREKAESAAAVTVNPQEKGGEREDVGSAHVDQEKAETVMGACKACGKNAADVVLMPCRHLCACKSCEESLTACPLCGVAKTSSIQVSQP